MPARLTPIGRLGGGRPLRTNQRGFALLITITLLAFLVLLLVSLASLTRVETQVATNSQQLSQARQNALMALNIALGQLQKAAGPDQRVTATADLAGNTNGARLPNANDTDPVNAQSVNGISNGLVKVQPGTRYWTGVWGNSNPSDPAQAGNIYERTPSPVLLNWMVSGNETTTFNASTAANTFGQITASNGDPGTTAPLFNPGIAPVLPSDTTKTGTIKDRTGNSHDIVLLVGPASVGDSNTPDRTLPDGSTEKYYDRYVAAPLVDIKADNATIPGLGNAGQSTIGRYAYWIGDEGVKAKYNLTDAYTVNTNPANDIKARYRLLSAQRNGIEQLGWLTGSADLTDFANYPGKDTNNLPAATTAAIENTLLPSQMRLGDTRLTEANAKAELHHITTCSKGVLADSYNGGLRRDLTSYLEADKLPDYKTETPYEPAKTKPIIPGSYSPAMGPSWDILKSFYGVSLYTAAADANTINVQAADATHVGISPVITQVRFLFGLKKSGANNQVLGGLVLMLGNPYTATLKSTSPVSFTVHLNPDFTSYGGTDVGIYANSMGSSEYKLVSKKSTNDTTAYGLLDRITFTISNLSIPPGETVCYTNTQTTIPATVAIAAGATGSATVPLTATTAPSFPPTAYFEADTGKAWVTQKANFDVWTTERGTGRTSTSPNGGATFLSYFIKYTDASGNLKTLTSVVGSDMPGFSGWMPGRQVSKDGTNPGFAYVWLLRLRSPSNNGVLVPARDWRTYCDYNIRAQEIINPWVAYRFNGPLAAPPYEFNYSGNSNYYTGDTYEDSSSPANKIGYWGRSASSIDAPPMLMQLFDTPRANRANGAYEIPVLSLGQLQHANLTADDQHTNIGHQPGNAVGNSYFTPFVTRANAVQSRADRFHNPATNPGAVRYFDISYLLNCALWDRYFFSTTPPTSTGYVLGADLPNNRLKPISTAKLNDLQDGRLAAGNLLINGVFNINSTSIDAWSALLASTNKLGTSKESSGGADAVFARSWNAPNPALNSFNTSKGKLTVAAAENGGGPTNPELAANEAYSGYRRLTPKQINVLAKAIVAEVRNRGPFVSLAHFINRTLAPTTDKRSLKGPLQAAIDSSGLNGSVVSAPPDGEILTFNGYDNDGTPPPPGGPVTVYADATTSSSWGSGTTQVDWGSKSTGIPGWLTQADILQSLGPVLAARSDTFVIRTYGESRNPLDTTTTGAPLARAWCEAVVQRLPEYVDSTDIAEKGNENPDRLATENQAFGRRFKVVSFRWLSAEDI